MLMVIPDPDKVTSNEPQEIPGLGVFPIAVSDTDKTRQEWEKLIKKTGAPLVVKDVRSDEKLDAIDEQATKTEKEA